MSHRRSFRLAAAVGGACWLLAAGPAAGTGLEPPRPHHAAPAPPPGQWQYTLTPYGWLMGVNGDLTARGHSVDVDASFLDLLENSDTLIGLMGYFEARRGRLGLFADAVWVKLGFPESFQAAFNPIADLNVSVGARAQVDYELTVIQAGMAYEIARWRHGASGTALDLLASARYWNQSVDLSLNVSGSADFESIGLRFNGSRAVASTGELDWVDPAVGARIRHRFASGADLTLAGDVGGFGVGSDFSWQAAAVYGFDVTCFGRPLRTIVGYRALAVDYSEAGPYGTKKLDFVLHGPVLGASLRW